MQSESEPWIHPMIFAAFTSGLPVWYPKYHRANTTSTLYNLSKRYLGIVHLHTYKAVYPYIHIALKKDLALSINFGL